MRPVTIALILGMTACKGQVRSTKSSVTTSKDDVRVFDTESGSPMPAAQALKSMKLPEGFTATLFASEPLVRQPIDMKVDARGRVWVAEAYWYPNDSGSMQDRITVLEDTNGDGAADKRTIFAEGLDGITSIEIGFGGVWVLAPPALVFYPDGDGDLKPDKAPVRQISSWNTSGGWNIANGLTFGPDGWLYGRQGQMGTSSPISARGSSPGRFSSGIWRYHPPSGKLEIVAQGMTNPWGLDWNDDGELFASGNCNGHLWHIIGGSLYDWGFGAREFPSEYGRTLPIEAAPHYAPGKDWWASWQERFEMADANDAFGGGHSHCGLLICNGNSWPETMRGHTLMSNIHGGRINEDTIEAAGSSYVSHRIGDPIKPADHWFRGVSVVAAPDGAFFVSDWSDTGECHDKSGIHRNSARIFRMVPAPLQPVAAIDTMDDAALLDLLTRDREEPARDALRTLQHRSLLKKTSPETIAKLGKMLSDADFKIRLRALSTLQGADLLEDAQLTAASHDADERVRSMAARYWADRKAPEATAARFLEMAKTDASPRVVLHLASDTRLLSAETRDNLTTALIGRETRPIDARTAQLLWHIRIQNPDFSSSDARKLIAGCKSATFATFLARYLVENDGSEGLDAIFTMAAAQENPVAIISAAIETARKGNNFMAAPKTWPELRKKWLASSDNAVRGLALSASVLFGDREALDGLRDQINDPQASLADKSVALETLAAAQTRESIAIVSQAFRDKKLRIPAIRAMRYFDQPAIASSFIQNWPNYDEAERHAVIDTLVTRKEWALLLLDAIGEKTIKSDFLTSAQARNLAESGDAALHAAVLKSWGDPARTQTQKEASLARATKLLAANQPGDPNKGRILFTQSCGICHTLYGEGGKLGPDLTGRNRADLPSLLQSIVDPSAQVPEEGRLSIVTRKDGTIVSGIIISKNASGLVIRSQQGEQPIKNDAVANIQTQTTSPMPEGLIDGLTDEQLNNLFAYLRADQADQK
ncbi:MAG: PVC-type heme-binding CxxCH protein [Luteolibacter sp.]|uniref:PVC-type heme-binding CxxCH protein n=1 Tax=Luteolibacter sp. TaxID=1962973 RepID=UPI003263EC18